MHQDRFVSFLVCRSSILTGQDGWRVLNKRSGSLDNDL